MGRNSLRGRALALLALAGSLEGAGCRASSPDAASCGPTTWGVPAYDALYETPPLVFEMNPETLLVRAGPVATLLEVACRADPDRLPPAARVALQNDVWGLWQRLEPEVASSPPRQRLREAASSLVQRLALPSAQLADLELPVRSGVTPEIHTALGEPAWEEQGSELAVLSHERVFGLRRLFGVYVAPGERALASQLVALDTQGHPHLTRVPGEVERLGHDDRAIHGARVWELDRRALRCLGPERALVEATEVRHVPGRGATRYLAEFDPAVPLSQLPCLQCHHDAQAMSLPQPADAAGIQRRRRALLEQVAPPWGTAIAPHP